VTLYYLQHTSSTNYKAHCYVKLQYISMLSKCCSKIVRLTKSAKIGKHDTTDIHLMAYFPGPLR